MWPKPGTKVCWIVRQAEVRWSAWELRNVFTYIKIYIDIQSFKTKLFHLGGVNLNINIEDVKDFNNYESIEVSTLGNLHISVGMVLGYYIFSVNSYGYRFFSSHS